MIGEGDTCKYRRKFPHDWGGGRVHLRRARKKQNCLKSATAEGDQEMEKDGRGKRKGGVRELARKLFATRDSNRDKKLTLTRHKATEKNLEI